MNQPLSIYVAASLRHLHAVRLLHAALRDAVPTVQILDWTEQATPPDGMTPSQRREWFDTELVGGQVYAFCRDSCVNADLVIYLGASGQDAGVEVGMAAAAGVPVLGIRGPLEAPGLMLHGTVSEWVDDALVAVKLVERIAHCEDGFFGVCGGCKQRTICPRRED